MRDVHEERKQSKSNQSKATQSNTNQTKPIRRSVSACGLCGMRAFFLASRGDVNAPTRSVEQPAASHAPSSLEQPADPLTSINALAVWQKTQGDDSSSPELRWLRAAVSVLAKKPKPKQEYVVSLCFAWGVQQKERQKSQLLATVIAELRQAVLAEGARLLYEPARSSEQLVALHVPRSLE